jgi:hypothetical protein
MPPAGDSTQNVSSAYPALSACLVELNRAATAWTFFNTDFPAPPIGDAAAAAAWWSWLTASGSVLLALSSHAERESPTIRNPATRARDGFVFDMMLRSVSDARVSKKGCRMMDASKRSRHLAGAWGNGGGSTISFGLA